jgi:hypothetical protein
MGIAQNIIAPVTSEIFWLRYKASELDINITYYDLRYTIIIANNIEQNSKPRNNSLNGLHVCEEM